MRVLSILFMVSCLFIGACEHTTERHQCVTGMLSADSIRKGIPTMPHSEGSNANLHLPAPRNFVYRETFVTLGNASVRYIETGMNDHPPIVLLHGAQLSAMSWKTLGTMRYLAQLGFHVISVDLPRHGKTGNPNVSKAQYLFQFLKIADIHHPIVLGQSYAGAYVLPFLVKYPQSAKAVILLAPTNIRDYAEPLKRVSVPALILWGGADEMISVYQANLLHKAMPNSILKIFPNAPHECYQTSKPQFHTEIGQFVKELHDPIHAPESVLE